MGRGPGWTALRLEAGWRCERRGEAGTWWLSSSLAMRSLRLSLPFLTLKIEASRRIKDDREEEMEAYAQPVQPIIISLFYFYFIYFPSSSSRFPRRSTRRWCSCTRRCCCGSSGVTPSTTRSRGSGAVCSTRWRCCCSWRWPSSSCSSAGHPASRPRRARPDLVRDRGPWR